AQNNATGMLKQFSTRPTLHYHRSSVDPYYPLFRDKKHSLHVVHSPSSPPILRHQQPQFLEPSARTEGFEKRHYLHRTHSSSPDTFLHWIPHRSAPPFAS